MRAPAHPPLADRGHKQSVPWSCRAVPAPEAVATAPGTSSTCTVHGPPRPGPCPERPLPSPRRGSPQPSAPPSGALLSRLEFPPPPPQTSQHVLGDLTTAGPPTPGPTGLQVCRERGGLIVASRGTPCRLKRASPGWGSRSGPGPSSTVTPQRGRPLSLWFSAEISCSLVSFTFLKPGHGVSCQILSDLAATPAAPSP